MKHCPYCGERAQDNARFCVKCGRSLENATEGEEVLLNRCAKCGYQPPKPSRFCTHCGASMVVDPNDCPKDVEEEEAPPQQTPPNPTPTPPPYGAVPYETYGGPVRTPQGELRSLCSKLKISAILLLITGCLQALGGIILAIAGIACIAVTNTRWDVVTQYGHLTYHESTALGVAGMIFCFIMGAVLIGVCIPNLICAGKTFSYSKQIKQNPVGITEHFRPVSKTVALMVVNILMGSLVGIVGSAFALAARVQVQNQFPLFDQLERESRSYNQQ